MSDDKIPTNYGSIYNSDESSEDSERDEVVEEVVEENLDSNSRVIDERDDELVSEESHADEGVGTTVMVNIKLRIRSEPSAHGDLIELVPSGSILKVLDSADTAWFKIQTLTNDPVTGYVKREFVTVM